MLGLAVVGLKVVRGDVVFGVEVGLTWWLEWRDWTCCCWAQRCWKCDGWSEGWAGCCLT